MVFLARGGAAAPPCSLTDPPVLRLAASYRDVTKVKICLLILKPKIGDNKKASEDAKVNIDQANNNCSKPLAIARSL
ncbi:unnamed protein product [Prunus armeniaca]|uniref:Uncharacterized protein n=1 Tax=Prunus armeniaca TaxID=36596 RepID=A0A6J5TF86_PRUAR|nr:unnamed protein product [Prunus armeniaca]